MAKRFFAALLFSAPMIAFAQDSSFSIRDYKYRTDGFRALALNIGLYGSNVSSDNPFSQKKKQSNLFLAPSNIGYYRIISQEKRWHESTISLSSSYQSGRSNTGIAEEKTSSFQGGVTSARTDRFYRGRSFFEIGNTLTATVNALKQESGISNLTNNRNQLSGNLIFGIGKGRIEYVQDAQMASFILDDLASQGLLQRAPGKDTYDEFARLLTDINNRRVFDSRRRRIYELTRIDSFLRNRGLAPSGDIRVFTTVNDNWALAFNPFRSSGTILYLRLQPSIRLNQNLFEEKVFAPVYRSDDNQQTASLSPVVGFEKYLPVSLRWQSDFGIRVNWQRSWSWRTYKEKNGVNTMETKTYSDQTQLGSYAYYHLGFYPNNRTVVDAYLNMLAQYGGTYKWDVTPELQLSASYFLGYRTRLTANLYARQNYYTTIDAQNQKIAGNLRTGSFSLGLTHFIL
jgi:hypothetical protein